MLKDGIITELLETRTERGNSSSLFLDTIFMKY